MDRRNYEIVILSVCAVIIGFASAFSELAIRFIIGYGLMMIVFVLGYIAEDTYEKRKKA